MMSDSSSGNILNISDFLPYAHGWSYLVENRLPDENHCDPVKNFFLKLCLFCSVAAIRTDFGERGQYDFQP